MALPPLSLALIALLPTIAPAPRVIAPSGSDFQAARADVDQANLAVNNDPEANLGELATAIELLTAYDVELAASPEGREALALAQLNLARALLVTGDEARAAEVMDQVIRSTHGDPLPIAQFGPKLERFHDQRRAQLDEAGIAAIQVHCQVSCRVLLDARPATTDSGPLYLGGHRVSIAAVDDSVERLDLVVTLDQPGVTTVVQFPSEPIGCDEPPPLTDAPTTAPASAPKRILPRWAEISVTAIGVGAAIAGGVMLGLDGRCPNGGDPVTDAAACPQIYEGTVPGLVALGFGSALIITGAVTLSVDEVRVGQQRGQQAVLGWRMRF